MFLPGGGDVAPPLLLSFALLCSVRAFSLLGEIITRHQAPGPDIHRSEKQRDAHGKRDRGENLDRLEPATESELHSGLQPRPPASPALAALSAV